MKKTFLGLGAVCLALAACGGGGGSGLSDSAVLGELSAAESMSLCEEVAGVRTVDCDGTPMDFGVDPESCDTAETFPAECTATVGDVRDCFDALDALSDAEICELTEFPAECDEVFSAACTGA